MPRAGPATRASPCARCCSPAPCTSAGCRRRRRPRPPWATASPSASGLHSRFDRGICATRRLHMSSSDKIEKKVTLRAPVARVWRAIADARQFGSWFGVTLHGEFAPGRTITGRWSEGFTEEMMMDFQKRRGLTPSKVKLPVGDTVFCTVEKIEPERYFSFRWIPYGIDAEADPEREP